MNSVALIKRISAFLSEGVDFNALEERAREMTDSELHYALLDAVKTAEAMDKIDRAEGGDRAGKYRDQASVYRAEMNKRRNR